MAFTARHGATLVPTQQLKLTSSLGVFQTQHRSRSVGLRRVFRGHDSRINGQQSHNMSYNDRHRQSGYRRNRTQRIGIKKLFVLLTLGVAVCESPLLAATCCGGANCTACSSCSSCKNCSKQGGSCSVCRPDLYGASAPRTSASSPSYSQPTYSQPRYPQPSAPRSSTSRDQR